MGITPLEKANQRLGKTASLLKKHAGGWELMGMDGSHADGFCHAGGGGSNGIAAYRTDYGDGSYGKDGRGWEPWETYKKKHPGGGAVRMFGYVGMLVLFTREIWLRLLPARGEC